MKTVFAHRGMSALAPENTLSAFALTKDYGIEWIECDVDVLGDGTVVVTHDERLDRCTNQSGLVYEKTAADLKEIDAGSWFSDEFINEPLPTLAQLIDLVNENQLNINVEIKSCISGWADTLRLIDGTIAALEKLNSNCQLIVSCFNPLALSEFKRRRPHTSVACLFEQATLQPDWLSILQACQAECVHPEDKGLTQAQVQAFKAQGYRIHVYTVNSLARANELFNWGVDGIFTDIAHLFPMKLKK
jgi:glycerophosphoryl diester phosphodiesterase